MAEKKKVEVKETKIDKEQIESYIELITGYQNGFNRIEQSDIIAIGEILKTLI